MRSLPDFNLSSQRVLVRCDFNVPLSEQRETAKRTSSSFLSSPPPARQILDDFRIKKSIPTLQYLIGKGAKLVLMSHLGRPAGKVVEELSLAPIQNKLMEYLDLSIVKAPDCLGLEIEKWTKSMREGEILLLENLRFHKGEEENDKKFAKELAKMGDIYINDAFGASHRESASIVGVPRYLPSGIGFLLEKEIKVLTNLIKNPQKPLVAIMGGKKVKTRVKLINKISEIGDWVLIGNLLKKEIEEKNIQLKYPEKIIKPVDDIEGKDIGPQTIDLFKEKIKLAKSIIWNGPLGITEEEKFSNGSNAIAQAIIQSKAFSVVGGGETVEFISKIKLTDKFNHVSTGGGAMIDFLADEKLAGLEVLK